VVGVPNIFQVDKLVRNVTTTKMFFVLFFWINKMLFLRKKQTNEGNNVV
jgi:hypothetical protein